MSLVRRLQAKTAAVITRTESHPAYRLFFDPADPLGQAGTAALLRNILLQSAHFGDHMTEAVFTAIGRFPKNKPQRMKPLVEQVLDEVFHPELAGRDFVRMGGDPKLLEPANVSPAAFVVAAVCRMLSERHSPFSYLGFVALMESTTPILTERLMPVLEKHGLARGSKFVPLHATEDHAHAATLWEEIGKVAETFPEAEPAVEFGFDALALVYPTLIWDEALRLTKAEGFGKE